MNLATRRTLFWAPRLLCIAFALFLSLFSVEAFSPVRTHIEQMTYFVLHLVPVGVILLLLAIAWRWELVGTFVFAALGVGYLGLTRDQPFPWFTYAAISGPLILAAVLFFLDWLYGTDERAAA
jgi:hypothetical protein